MKEEEIEGVKMGFELNCKDSAYPESEGMLALGYEVVRVRVDLQLYIVGIFSCQICVHQI